MSICMVMGTEAAICPVRCSMRLTVASFRDELGIQLSPRSIYYFDGSCVADAATYNGNVYIGTWSLCAYMHGISSTDPLPFYTDLKLIAT